MEVTHRPTEVEVSEETIAERAGEGERGAIPREKTKNILA